MPSPLKRAARMRWQRHEFEVNYFLYLLRLITYARMKNSKAQLSADAQQVYYEALAKGLTSEAMASSDSWLDRVARAIYQQKAVSSYEMSAEKAGCVAVEGFMQRVQQCIDKNIAPKHIMNVFLPHEKQIMLEQMDISGVSDEQKSDYIALKKALPRRAILAGGTAAIAGAAIASIWGVDAKNAKYSQQKNATYSALEDSRKKEQDSIEKLIARPDQPDPQVIRDIAEKREDIRQFQAQLKEQYEATNKHSAFLPLGLSVLMGGSVALLLTYSAFEIHMKRESLENYEGNSNVLGIGATLNEQLIDQGLKIEVDKFRDKVDAFFEGVLSQHATKKPERGG